MDLIERQMAYGRWFTRTFLEAGLALPDEQLDREVDPGQRTFRQTAVHLVNVVEAETGRISGETAPERLPEDAPIADVLGRHETAFDAFEAAAREVVSGGEDRQRATYLDNYGIPQSYGGTVLFVITQNVLRIQELRSFLGRLGVEGLLDGDVQEWEHFSGSIDAWGGRYPEGFVRPWA